MSKKKGGHGGGGHGGAWVITFADLMSLLMAFFVMLLSFSTQDQEKLKEVAGAMREAFGAQPIARKNGMIEKFGAPVRDYVLDVAVDPKMNGSEFASERMDERKAQGPEANTHDFQTVEGDRPREFLTAAESLRQALQDLPEITEQSKQIAIEVTSEGLDIRLMDQDGRAMFNPGSADPDPRLVAILGRIAPILESLPNKVKISGHTESSNTPSTPGGPEWVLSAQRALSAAQVLGSYGVTSQRLDMVVGEADVHPLFPDDPFLSANRRIDIVLLKEAPSLPPSSKP